MPLLRWIEASLPFVIALGCGASSGRGNANIPDGTSPPPPGDSGAASASGISIVPRYPGVFVNGTINFSVNPSVPVTWNVDDDGGCGSISGAGVYTAPASAGICHITATPQPSADAGGPAHAAINVYTNMPGTWVNISPSGVNYAYVAIKNYGFQAMDGAKPDQTKTLYVGTCNEGIWKTTDEGNTWNKTGPVDNDSGRNWSLVVDNTNSDIVYTMSGFGVGQGLWKTTDGGTTWKQTKNNITNGDLSHIEMDPYNHLHLLATEHSGTFGLWETTDGGSTWTSRGDAWGGHNTFVYFLGQDDSGKQSSAYWLGFAESNGLWRTSDSGAHWTQVSTTFSRSHAGAGLYRASSQALYAGVNSTIGRSADNGVTWVDLATRGNLPTSPDAYAGIVGDGAQVFSMLSNTGVSASGPYHWYVTPENGNGQTWTQYNTQTFQDGPGIMLFDRVNRIVYTTQWSTGVFRLLLQ